MASDSKPVLPNPSRYFVGDGELLPRFSLELAAKGVGIHFQRDAVIAAARGKTWLHMQRRSHVRWVL
jgi:predicted hotdog family 3-hydroxylacyl-ACP dehydratase